MLCKSLRLVPAFKCSTKQGQRRQHKLRNRLGSSMLILLFPLWVITDHRADQLCLHPKINTLVVVFFALKACPRWVLYEKWGMDSGGNDTIACSLKTRHKIQASAIRGLHATAPKATCSVGSSLLIRSATSDLWERCVSVHYSFVLLIWFSVQMHSVMQLINKSIKSNKSELCWNSWEVTHSIHSGHKQIHFWEDLQFKFCVTKLRNMESETKINHK